ncbi:MAG: carboxypeptidase-like regulatory domain-containing protein [Bacteroidales bacterium]|nr:carboxypeptidase-like regulatory domain-containing protein [Bacteroidales bacterium]
MKKYLLYIVGACVWAGCHQLSAQEILLQWTGTVRNDLLEPLPYVHILVKKDYRGTVSDAYGKFTIVSYPNDTLLVSCVGYKALKIPVPRISQADPKHYLKDIIMETDTIMLREVVIFPWRTYTEFKEAFMSLDVPEDDLQRAYMNIAAIKEQIYQSLSSRSASPTTNFRDVMAQRNTRVMNYGHMYPTYMITNPLAWANFFKALRDGEFKKKKEDSESTKSSAVEEYNKYQQE